MSNHSSAYFLIFSVVEMERTLGDRGHIFERGDDCQRQWNVCVFLYQETCNGRMLCVIEKARRPRERSIKGPDKNVHTALAG